MKKIIFLLSALLIYSACKITLTPHDTQAFTTFSDATFFSRQTGPFYYILRHVPQTYVLMESLTNRVFGAWHQNGDTIFFQPKFYVTNFNIPLKLRMIPFDRSDFTLYHKQFLISGDTLFDINGQRKKFLRMKMQYVIRK